MGLPILPIDIQLKILAYFVRDDPWNTTPLVLCKRTLDHFQSTMMQARYNYLDRVYCTDPLGRIAHSIFKRYMDKDARRLHIIHGERRSYRSTILGQLCTLFTQYVSNVKLHVVTIGLRAEKIFKKSLVGLDDTDTLRISWDTAQRIVDDSCAQWPSLYIYDNADILDHNDMIHISNMLQRGHIVAVTCLPESLSHHSQQAALAALNGGHILANIVTQNPDLFYDYHTWRDMVYEQPGELWGRIAHLLNNPKEYADAI